MLTWFTCFLLSVKVAVAEKGDMNNLFITNQQQFLLL